MKRFRSKMAIAVGFAVLSANAWATPLEQFYISKAGWCPDLGPGDIQTQHAGWHLQGLAGKHFVEFHREFIANCDDFRIYESFPGDRSAVVPVVAQPGSLLKYGHQDNAGTGFFVRPPGQDVTTNSDGGFASPWTSRPAYLRLRNAVFHGFNAGGFSVAIETGFHNSGHGTIAFHDKNGDMGSPATAPRDGAFFHWHKNVDNIYSDWIAGQYRLIDNTGTPVYFSLQNTIDSVAPPGVPPAGTAGSAVAERGMATEYNFSAPAANDFGALRRMGSDIYVGDSNPLLPNQSFSAGIRNQWALCVGGANAGKGCRVAADCPGGACPASTTNAWDIDAWTILNPPHTGWYFSVASGSVGLAGTAVNGQAAVSRPADVYVTCPATTNCMFRTEAVLGLVASAKDNLDALEVDDQKRIQGTNDSNRPGIANRPKQWFSLRSGSTFGVMASPCGGGAAVAVGPNDILQFNANGDLCIAVAAAVLGLAAAGNELDGLVITDVGATVDSLDATDNVYYSLATGSPALGAACSGADIFCVKVGGGGCGALGGPACGVGGTLPAGSKEILAAGLGLLATDDVDALDVTFSLSGNGACCRAGGTCQDNIPQPACPNPDVWWGPNTVCSAAECPSAHGACCQRDGTCTMLSDVACADAAGIFMGPGVICPGGGVCVGGPTPGLPCTSNLQCGPPPPAGGAGVCRNSVCPATPPNDECYNAYDIPYGYDDSNYYSIPPEYRDNTYATSYPNYTPNYYSNPPNYGYGYDPPYSCHDHMTFASPYGSGSVWYRYQVPAPRGGETYRPIRLSTYDTYRTYGDGGGYGYGGGAGDTKIELYYSPDCDCVNMQPAPGGCYDNEYSNYPPQYSEPYGYPFPPYPPQYQESYGVLPYRPYAYVPEYMPTQPGCYYVQVSTAYESYRGNIALQVSNPRPASGSAIPTVSEWGLVVLTLVMLAAGSLILRYRTTAIA